MPSSSFSLGSQDRIRMLKEFGPAFLLLQMECRILRRRKFMRVTDTSGWADFETNEDPSKSRKVGSCVSFCKPTDVSGGWGFRDFFTRIAI